MDLRGIALLGTLIHAVLYGIYLTLSVIAFYCVYHTRSKAVAPNRAVMGISAALFVAITLFCVLSVVCVVGAFVVRADTSIDSFAESIQTGASAMARLGVFFLVNFFVDCLLIYRLYTIYLRSLQIVILPIVMKVVYLGSAVFQLVLAAQEPDIANNLKIRAWAPVNVSEAKRGEGG